jgi:hypothetical protein
MFSITVGPYTVSCHPDRLPDLYGQYVERAGLVEEFDLEGTEGTCCFLAVSRGVGWPFLVVAQRYDPAGGFRPGGLLVPETGLLFIAAGERLLAYRLDSPARLWMDTTDCGFWGWARHGERVILSAELELAAWDVHGRKSWPMFVEPPWGYEVSAGMIELDVMGTKSSSPLAAGPPQSPR